ncbi:hypothetical protein JTB14_023654 [Gonioctena quinquepunctata]|nr:hypothetical protein JTB14_023654 [Gonioctena quinquepunctata]
MMKLCPTLDRVEALMKERNMAALTENRNVCNKCICKYEREQEEKRSNFEEDEEHPKALTSEVLSLIMLKRKKIKFCYRKLEARMK